MSNHLTPERLARIQARLDAANAEMDRLTASNPGTAWRWSIPAQPNRDSDLVLSAPLADIRSLLAHIDALTDHTNQALDMHHAQDGLYGNQLCFICSTPSDRGQGYPCPTRLALDGGHE